MVGFSGAVEDGVRNKGLVISAILALVLGYGYRSAIVGLGAFVAGSLISHLWAAHAGERFRQAQYRRRPDDAAPVPEPGDEGNEGDAGTSR